MLADRSLQRDSAFVQVRGQAHCLLLGAPILQGEQLGWGEGFNPEFLTVFRAAETYG